METISFNETILTSIQTFYPNCVYYDLTDENDALILWDSQDNIISLFPIYCRKNKTFIYDTNYQCYIEL